MKFSVVIPLYNKQSYIQDTLRSAMDQTFEDYEIIVVNDGSTDDSLRCVQEVADGRVRIINQENAGVSCARNTGVLEAKGEFIAFLDADDLWQPDHLEILDQLTERYPESGFFVTAYRVLLSPEKARDSVILPQQQGCLDSYWLTLDWAYDFVNSSIVAIRRKTLIDAGLFRIGERLGQDLDMWTRVARMNPKVAYDSRQTVSYVRYAEQNARTRIKIAYPEAYLRDLEEELEDPRHTETERAAIQHRYDRKMTVYVFTCALYGERKRAFSALKEWKGKKTRRNRMLRFCLRCALMMPKALLKFAYQIRLRVF